MSSYVVTGAGRGLGYSFVKILASNSENTVIGLVRNVKATNDRLAADGISNVHVVEITGITDGPSLTQAAKKVEEIVGDAGVDYLINNAAYLSEVTAWKPLSNFTDGNYDLIVDDLNKSIDTNVNGILKTIYAFLPLIKKGEQKKVVAISSGTADLDAINEVKVTFAAPYTISKAALNMLMAKFNASYAKDGILFISICPGVVDTSEGKEVSEEEIEGKKVMNEMFKDYAPNFQGPSTADESAASVLAAIYRSSLEGGHGGIFISHNGTRRWL